MRNSKTSKRSKMIFIVTAIILAVLSVVGFFLFKRSQDKIRFPVGNSDVFWMTLIPADDTSQNTFKKMMTEVNAYRNSGQFSRDNMTTRGEKIYEILAEYEGTVIEEGTLEIGGSSVTGRTIIYEGGFEVGFRDAEYYWEQYMTHN